MRRDLLHWIGERVKGFVALVAEDLVLDRDDGFQKDIVERFRLDAHVELLDAKGEASHLLLAGAEDQVKAGLSQAREFPKALNQRHFGRRNCKAARNAHCLILLLPFVLMRLVVQEVSKRISWGTK